MTARTARGIRYGFGRRPGAGSGGALAVALAVLAFVGAPFAALLALAFGSSGGTWPHLLTTVLPGSTVTTLLLMAGVGIATGSVGVGTAWLVTMCRFPGRRVLEFALVLPLAVPVYIIAYCYVELLDFSGPFQSGLRSALGFTSRRDYWFPEIRSLPGAIFAMSAVLFPYVYMTVRVLFLTQSSRIVDVSRTLGASPLRMFWQIGLPLARPAVAAGVSLALMETINDIGAVEFFGVRTLTFSIYQTWLNRSDLAGAAQLSCVLLVVVILLIAAERSARGRQRYAVAGGTYPLPPSSPRLARRGGLSRLLRARAVRVCPAGLADGRLRIAPNGAVRRTGLARGAGEQPRAWPPPPPPSR
jgi:iron(III) transport system permease protein